MSPFIRLHQVCKSFGTVPAVDNLSLEIGRGELFCLLGASGSGKTTLLRILAGFEKPDSGGVEIDGQNMHGVDPADRPVNIMFQNYALFPHYSVAKNIGYGLRRAGVKGQDLKDRIDALLKMVRLKGYGTRKPHQLSGGQRQRVALARALARKPKLLLLDEPLAALDKKLREDTQFELVSLQEQLGTTFMVVTHDQEEAMILADRIGVMEKGRLIQVDKPKTLYEKPHNKFIADFLGSVSFIDATVVAQKKTAVLLDSADGQITAESTQNLHKNAHVTAAIRPEKITLSRKKTTANCFKVTVEDIAYTGVATYYRVLTENGQMLKIHQHNNTRAESFGGEIARGRGETLGDTLPETLDWDETGYASFDAKHVIVLTE